MSNNRCCCVELNQRNKWIDAIKRNNVDGWPWYPKPDDTICSEHFMGNKKSDEEESPSYAPTIFPKIYRKRKVNDSQVLARYTRLKKRRTTKVSDTTSSQIIIEEGSELYQTQPLMVDQGCQVNMFSESKLRDTTFICIRLIYSDHCDAEIQVNIATTSRIVMTNNSRKKEAVALTKKSYEDQSTETKIQEFVGISSIKNDQELLDLAGVSFSNFEFLLRRLTMKKCTVSTKDRLLIFLIKMKTGVTFSALSVLFGVHRTTTSRIFHSILQNLACATANLIFWPNRATVQATIPKCFSPDYINTRVIIDCTEFRIEIPTAVDDRVACYSHYKKGFTAKVLIGITPGGFISFKSKVAGGRKTDSQMTVESRLVDLLETGDVVLADKGFPSIKKVIDESGKEVKIVTPPFLANKNELSQEETQRTYDIARVRIHVERIMQRLRIYWVLDKIPHNLFNCIDDIVHCREATIENKKNLT
ncbi:unnamed protein product [Parnassius mnemosyne]|uniref:THAP-type domain-containing protein n=2 Tax=Parnassius mnemosyne TaxID=213953 RepID=A0AAV1LBD7_9NEOP